MWPGRVRAHDNEARMVGVSIVALSLLVSIADVPRIATVSHEPTAAFPGFKLPSIPRPRVRMPHLPKRKGSNEALMQTERRLKAMVRDQEAWYSDHGRYGANAHSVAANVTRADSTFSKVQVQMLFAGKKGWTAMASHPDAPGKTCVVYVGHRSTLPLIPRTRADAVDASREGQPACDR